MKRGKGENGKREQRKEEEKEGETNRKHIINLVRKREGRIEEVFVKQWHVSCF